MYLNEATLLHNIKVRYSKDRIYVSITCHVNQSNDKCPFKKTESTKKLIFSSNHRTLKEIVPL